MLLADTSVWVDLLRGTSRGPELAALLRAGEPVASTEPVLMELLAGTRDAKEYATVRGMVMSCPWIAVDPAGDFEAAARIYGLCREAGFTPRGLIDCLIAAIALRSGATVMSSDRDFARIADVIPITLHA